MFALGRDRTRPLDVRSAFLSDKRGVRPWGWTIEAAANVAGALPCHRRSLEGPSSQMHVRPVVNGSLALVVGQQKPRPFGWGTPCPHRGAHLRARPRHGSEHARPSVGRCSRPKPALRAPLGGSWAGIREVERFVVAPSGCEGLFLRILLGGFVLDGFEIVCHWQKSFLNRNDCKMCGNGSAEGRVGIKIVVAIVKFGIVMIAERSAPLAVFSFTRPSCPHPFAPLHLFDIFSIVLYFLCGFWYGYSELAFSHCSTSLRRCSH